MQDLPQARLHTNIAPSGQPLLKHLQEKVGITFVHVTHNQEEAMTIADRIALIADGHLVECADAREMYEAPQHRFTADFIGDNNLLDGIVSAVTTDHVTVAVGEQKITVNRRGLEVQNGQPVSVSIRSELTQLSEDTTATSNAPVHTPVNTSVKGTNELRATFREATYLGLTTSSVATLATGVELVSRIVTTDSVQSPAADTPVILSWHPDAPRLHLPDR